MLDFIFNYCYIFCRSVDYFLHQNIFPKWKSCKGASIFSCCGGEDLCGSRHYLDKIDKSKRKRLKKRPSSIVDNLSLYLLFWLRKGISVQDLLMCLTCHFYHSLLEVQKTSLGWMNTDAKLVQYESPILARNVIFFTVNFLEWISSKILTIMFWRLLLPQYDSLSYKRFFPGKMKFLP